MHIYLPRRTVLVHEIHERWHQAMSRTKLCRRWNRQKRKEDVASFISMIQAHAKFIPVFSKLTANIRALQKKNARFHWTDAHQNEFDMIKKYFSQPTTLSFFDPGLPTWIFVDAAKGGQGVIITQGQEMDNTNVIAFASRTTTAVERKYPQIDLEAMAVDFGLRRFREYCVGAKNIKIVTDHRPLIAIFENKRLGSIRIDRTKLRHQDIDYKIGWRSGKLNPSDYLSRHPTRIHTKYEEEATEDAKLLYALHNDNLVMKEFTLSRICEETSKDEELQLVMGHIRSNTRPNAPELASRTSIPN